jgi:hypothetical protein
LSNGDFLGPRPASLAQRHQDLYETFADSWRVDTTSSLFDYEHGLTPASFVVPGWPVSEAQNCTAPVQPGVPVPSAASTTPIDQPQAEQICQGIADTQRRENCVQDVMATGDAVFAETYLHSQDLDQRILIAPPALSKPENNTELPSGLVDFEWQPVPDTEEVDVRHYHCLWKSTERYDFNNCTVLAEDGSPLGDFLPPTLDKLLSPFVCIILVVILLILALVLFLANKRRVAVVVALLAVLLAVLCWLHSRPGYHEPTSVRIGGLESGESYRWKVVTETEDGLLTESETLRFEMAD